MVVGAADVYGRSMLRPYVNNADRGMTALYSPCIIGYYIVLRVSTLKGDDRMSESMSANEVLLTFANRIRMMRLQQGWSREELAERAGINVYTLKHFERSGQISLERFIKLCAALDSLEEVSRVLKPRQRVNVNDWTVPEASNRQRGRRREKLELDVLEAEMV